ncbi:hypothetical protein RND81_13G057600 [Saponaria officinalis]|uniref:DUF7769 domain-containing protein n=1 Tax=Saponaria officinalis TaxID=3572 RepID=A0AAW1GXA2_SAPOF
MRGPNLTDDERHKIACSILENSINYKTKRGIMKLMASQFQVDRRTIFEVWRTAKAQRQSGQSLNLTSKMPGKEGRPSIEVPVEKIMNTSKSERTTLEQMGIVAGVSKSTVKKWVIEGKLKVHSSAIHPQLSADNKLLRLKFVISKLYFDKILKILKFKDMNNVVHIDEKWFNMTQTTARYYLVDGEIHPHRTCKSKRFITKIMFMTAIGIFPFTYQQPAKRRSKNREAGTLETKAIESIDKEVIKTMLLNNVIPAIKRKWPSCASKTIFIQQDNARPHTKANDPEFLLAATSDGFDIQLTHQPANSPDLNVLDLGFFRSIQSLQTKKNAKTVDELIRNVEKAWEEEKADCLNDMWLSLQACMLEIMKRRGQNDYKLPHLKKQTLRRQGILPTNLEANDVLVKECIELLILVGRTTNLDELFADLGIEIPN